MSEDKEQNLIQHLQDLRQVLIKSFLALGLGLIPMFILAPYVIDWLINIMISKHDITLNYFSPMEVFLLQIKTAVVLDLLICFPYIAKQFWNFILPALYDKEQRFIKSIVLTSSLLFCLGAVFCIFLILPLLINFSMSFSQENITPVLGISNVISLALRLSVVFGLMFQFPLVTFSVIRAGIVSYEDVKNKRPYIFVIILIVAALLTPPDVISQLMLAIPTYLLFEMGLYFARNKTKQNKVSKGK